MSEDQQLKFIVEWQEPCAAVPRQFLLTYYISDSTVSLFDYKRKKLFLRRTECSTLSFNNLSVGNTVVVLARDLLIKDYGDIFTKEQLHTKIERGFGGIQERGFKDLGNIFNLLRDANITVKKIKLINPSAVDKVHFQKWLGETSRKLIDENIVVGHNVILMELWGDRAVSKWNSICNSSIYDYMFGSSSFEMAIEELRILFSENRPVHCNTVKMTNSVCCVIKPHILAAALIGDVLNFVLDLDFTISAIEMFYLTRKQADDFFQVYKEIFVYYSEMLDEIVSGPCIVLEISSSTSDTHKRFRELIGPHDSQLAKQIRPTSLRAKFGANQVKNAVHCTDLQEDSKLELEYFFKLLR